MHPRKEKLMELLNKLLPEAKEQEAILDFAFDKVVDDVSNYTHLDIEQLPEKLDNTIVSMVIGVMNEFKLNESAGSEVSSLTEGDTSISFVSPVEAYQKLSSVNTVTSDYYLMLNQFRVLR